MTVGPPRYPIVWEDSPWEQELWQPEVYTAQVRELIETVAAEYGRQDYIAEHVPTPIDPSFGYSTNENGQIIRFWHEPTPRALALALDVNRIVRTYKREQSALVIRQVDIPRGDEPSKSQRIITVRRDRQKRSTAQQVRSIEKAVKSSSDYQIERSWFALTPRAKEYLSVGCEIARRKGVLDGYAGSVEVMGKIVHQPMFASDLLAAILPYAIKAVSLPGRRPTHPRDEALADIFAVFVEASGVVSAAARRGGHDEPVGAGADFVRTIERIYSLELLPLGSTHAFRRAKARMPRP